MREIIIDLDKKQYHMLARAILDDLYEMKSRHNREEPYELEKDRPNIEQVETVSIPILSNNQALESVSESMTS